MKRPKDKAIEAVAALLKEWHLDGNPTTAAVLLLDAAAKALQPPKMKKRTDEEMVRFLDGIVGAVEATREEYHSLYSRYTKEYGKSWESNSSGLFETVGYLDDRPVCISLRTAVVEGHKILFVEATSQVVDHVLIDEWLRLNIPSRDNSEYPNKVDVTNFHNIFPRKSS